MPTADRGEGTQAALNHLGVEVDDTVAVAAHADRLRAEGMATAEEIDTTCCYALQDKVWVHDPAGAPWEVYAIKDDNPDTAGGLSCPFGRRSRVLHPGSGGGRHMLTRPSVLFVCVHNAGRSQMAAAYLTHLAGDRVDVRSAGSAPAETVNPAVVAALAEDGIDISAEVPKVLTVERRRRSPTS